MNTKITIVDYSARIVFIFSMIINLGFLVGSLMGLHFDDGAALKFSFFVVLTLASGTLLWAISYIDQIIEQIRENILLTQEMVDARLSTLAIKFIEAGEREIKLQRTQLSPSEFEKVTEEVQDLKEEFWQAHKLAKNLGYEVKNSVRDYVLGVSRGSVA